MNLLRHSWHMTVRHLLALWRQPWWIAISLAQPITYLVLYGQLFNRVVELPGFQAKNYMTFVTPGIVIMMSIFGGGWNGMGIIMELDNGVMDRFLVSPVSRFAIIAGRLIQMSIILVVQTARENLATVAQSSRVQGIEPRLDRAPANDLSRARLGVAADTVTSEQYLGLAGPLFKKGMQGVYRARLRCFYRDANTQRTWKRDLNIFQGVDVTYGEFGIGAFLDANAAFD